MRIPAIVLTLALVSCASNPASPLREPAKNQEVSPRLFIQPAPVFDMECGQRTGFKIDPQWYTELFKKTPLFQKHWNEQAEALIAASEQAAGRKFSRSQYSVALTLCKWTPMGHPFIVSVRPYLDGPAKADPSLGQPMSMNTFVSMTHHELLHSLVDNLLSPDFDSPLLIKYKSEAPNVLVHLHLMAIQKASYEKLNKRKMLEATNHLYAFIGGDYQRAWEIVAKEGTQPFLAELRAFNAKPATESHP